MPGRQSIIRRSLALILFYVIGHGFNYLLLLTSNRLLLPDVFALFYISISLINVMMTPGPILAMSLGQHFSRLAVAGGRKAVGEALRNSLVATGLWTGMAAIVAIAALAVIGQQLGVESFAIILLIPAIAWLAILFEIVRATFQALHEFVWFGATWVLWCALHVCFVITGLYLVESVWAGLVGSLLATLLLMSVTLAFLPMDFRVRGGGRDVTVMGFSANVEAVIAPLMAYGFFNLIANADVLLGYVVLGRDQLGVYVASSILPKAIVTVTLPAAQVLLPVLAARGEGGGNTRPAVIKAILLVLTLASAGAFVLWMAGGSVCNTEYGIRSCDAGLMSILAFAAIPLSTVRVLVVTSLAADAKWRPLVQLVGLAAIGLTAGISAYGSAYRLAIIYLLACIGVAVLYFAADLISGPRRRIRVSV